jgi:hypothetical protein
VLSLLVLLAGGFFHSRVLIVLLFAIFILFTVNWWLKFDAIRIISFIILGMFMLELLDAINSSQWMFPLTDSYARDAAPLFFICVLLIPAIIRFPAQTFAILLFVAMIFGALFLPLRGVEYPFGEQLYLMDRPYVQIILYLPLSLLGGYGFFALYQDVQINMDFIPKQAWILPLLVVGYVFFVNHDFRASTCCQVAGVDDLAAYGWISANLPEDTKIAIASSRLKVSEDALVDSKFPSDGGVWIAPLTGRDVLLLSRSLDFTTKYVLGVLCRSHVDYLYVGKSGLGFNEEQMIRRYPWYEPVFMLPGAKVYKLVGCVEK